MRMSISISRKFTHVARQQPVHAAALVTVSLAAIIAAAKTINGNTTLTFPDHTALTLIGVNHVDVGIFA